MHRRVLIIEDDRDIARLARLHLEDLGCDVTVEHDGQNGLDAALGRAPWNLIVLDLTLPMVEGLEICRRLRASECNAPILMVTARAGELECVVGLESGADDYVTKPFSVIEFSARAKALLRRAERLSATASPGPTGVLRSGDLELQVERRVARRKGAAMDLTAKEFDLLAHFMRHPGVVFSRCQLLEAVWGANENYEHTVNSHINRLRSKIEADSAHPIYIVTVWGVGYKFDAARGEAES